MVFVNFLGYIYTYKLLSRIIPPVIVRIGFPECPSKFPPIIRYPLPIIILHHKIYH